MCSCVFLVLEKRSQTLGDFLLGFSGILPGFSTIQKFWEVFLHPSPYTIDHEHVESQTFIMSNWNHEYVE